MTTTHRILQRLGQAWLWGLLLVFCGATFAQSQAQGGDPPGRVARLSELNGQVWLYSPDAGDWVNATRNQPLTTGDRLATDAGGRAELQIGSTTLRLDASSEAEVLALDDNQVALQLHSGSAVARVRSAEAAREFSLTTAEGRFRIDQPGRFRFDRPQGDRAASVVTVYNGQATYEGDRTALAVTPGQRAEFWIDAARTAQYSLAEPARDDFMAWNDERDGRDAVSISSRYVSPEMTGADDLDRYGSWDQSPEYGAIWTPRNVAADWAPYSTGRWAFVRPWGWTWVDDAPWGFAPFHYGRWVYATRGWCWVPGVRVPRPVYAPALVAWVGGGRGDVSVSIGGGPSVGWFPLAPRDVYVPGYRYSPRYVREVNYANVRDARRIDEFVNTPAERRDFGNRRFPHALTVVPASVVSGRQPVAQSAAQWRAGGGERGFGGGAALAAAPVGAPQPVRVVDPRTVRPPGVPRAEVGGQRPGAPRDAAGGNRPGFGEAGAPRPTSRGDFVNGGRPLPDASPRSTAEPSRRGDAREQPANARPAIDADGPRTGSRTAPVVRPGEPEERRALPGTRNEVGAPPPRPSVRERGDDARPVERRSAPQAALDDREERRAMPGTTNDARFSRARGDDRPPSNRDDAAAARSAPRADGRPVGLPQAAPRPAPRNESRNESRMEPPRPQREAEAPRAPSVRSPEPAQVQRPRSEPAVAERRPPGAPRPQER